MNDLEYMKYNVKIEHASTFKYRRSDIEFNKVGKKNNTMILNNLSRDSVQ